MTKDLDEAQHKAMIPMGRFGTPEEVAEAVAVPGIGESFVHYGTVINVNGGLYT